MTGVVVAAGTLPVPCKFDNDFSTEIRALTQDELVSGYSVVACWESDEGGLTCATNCQGNAYSREAENGLSHLLYKPAGPKLSLSLLTPAAAEVLFVQLETSPWASLGSSCSIHDAFHSRIQRPCSRCTSRLLCTSSFGKR
jgi:hypothetical protein